MATKRKEKKLKRTYPEKECKNVIDCISGGKFIPHDKRQKFYISKCGENYRNDLRNEANNLDFANEKLLRKYDKKLEKLFYNFVDLSNGRAIVWIEFFRYEGVDLTFLVYENTNTNTGNPVKWFYHFGVERHAEQQDYFIIYKRKIKDNGKLPK